MRGVRADRYGLRAYVKVAGIQREKRFPHGTDPDEIKKWRSRTESDLRAGLVAPVPTPLADDFARYREQVRSMPTFAQRSDHLDAWEAELGATTDRAAIRPEHIRAVLQRWRQTLSAATCNKRRSALMHVWSVLDGKDARNPVRAVPKFRVDDPLPRGRDPHAIDAALRRAPRCRSRACCRVMLWTGMRPDELDRATPDDLDLKRRTLIVRTAKGGRSRVVPLTKQAVSAWREFLEAKAWHQVPEAAPLGRWLKEATGMPTLRVYDLRHSYGTALALRGTRLDVIAALMGHSTLDLTRRYLLAAVAPDAAKATARLSEKAGSRRNVQESA